MAWVVSAAPTPPAATMSGSRVLDQPLFPISGRLVLASYASAGCVLTWISAFVRWRGLVACVAYKSRPLHSPQERLGVGNTDLTKV